MHSYIRQAYVRVAGRSCDKPNLCENLSFQFYALTSTSSDNSFMSHVQQIYHQ